MQTRKNLLSLVLLIAPIAVLAAEPILTASTETHSPDERIPAQEIVEAMLQTAQPDDLESLASCATEQGLTATQTRSLFSSVVLPRLNATERVHFLRPALQPYCFTFYGAHLFRYWLIAEREQAGAKHYAVLWSGIGDAFEVLPAITYGQYTIRETNCTATACRTRELRFNGQAYSDAHCTRTAFDKSGKEITRDEPCL